MIFMKSIDKLKAASNLKDVAKVIHLNPGHLAYILYISPELSRYKQFTIPKASGGTRKITAPISDLKSAQRRLAKLLQECLKEIEKKQGIRKNYALSHGFKPNLSIATNARNHVNRRWVLNMDLKDFFPSINFGRVRGFFIKNKHFSLHPKAATVLAQIACHQNALPQGAPTSPVISNLIAGILDIRLNEFAYKNRCTFTRYADDITFSTNLKEFPASIAKMKPDGEWEISDRLLKQINKYGFEVNDKKTRMQYRRSRQDVTGLIVNKKIGIKREVLKTVRAQVEKVARTGECYTNEEVKGKIIRQNVEMDVLRGHLAHIEWVKRHYEEYEQGKGNWKKVKGEWKKVTGNLRKKEREKKQDNSAWNKDRKGWSDELGYVYTYRRFLDHQAFVANPIPTIICEGETDNIYLQSAITCIPYTPLLNKKSARSPKRKTADNLNVKLFRYTETTDSIQRLGGSSGNLKNLIYYYKRRMKQVYAEAIEDFQSPVILVVDNDSGAKDINSLARKCLGKSVNGSKDFYYLGLNLYLVHTPGPNTEIEDFLPKKVLKTKIRDKTFEPDNKKFDKNKHYGKTRLAKHVWRHKDNVDFSGYLPLLERINKAINDFRNMQNQVKKASNRRRS